MLPRPSGLLDSTSKTVSHKREYMLFYGTNWLTPTNGRVPRSRILKFSDWPRLLYSVRMRSRHLSTPRYKCPRLSASALHPRAFQVEDTLEDNQYTAGT